MIKSAVGSHKLGVNTPAVLEAPLLTLLSLRKLGRSRVQQVSTFYLFLDWSRANFTTVQDALQRKGVHVVTYDWLEDCLVHSRKIKESKYLWEKISKDAVKKCLQKEKLAAKQKKQEEKKKEKGTSTTRAFVGHLADYDDKKTKKKKAQAKLLKEPKAPAERKKRRTAEEKARDEATEKARRVVDREKAAGFQDLLSGMFPVTTDCVGHELTYRQPTHLHRYYRF